MSADRAPLSTRSRIISHAGYLSYKAAEIFYAASFTNIGLQQAPMMLSFPEKDLADRCAKAAHLVAGINCCNGKDFA